MSQPLNSYSLHQTIHVVRGSQSEKGSTDDKRMQAIQVQNRKAERSVGRRPCIYGCPVSCSCVLSPNQLHLLLLPPQIAVLLLCPSGGPASAQDVNARSL